MEKFIFKCLYVHDHKFKVNDNMFYSEGKMTDEVLSRYIAFQDSLSVISRIEEIDDPKGLSKIQGINVSFFPVKGLSFSKIFSYYFLANTKLIFSNIIYNDFVVIRLPSFLGVYTLLLNMLIRKKFFIEMVGDPKEALITSRENINLPFKLFACIFSGLNSFFIKRADGVIYVTQFALQKAYPTNGLADYASNVEVLIQERFIDIKDYEVNEKNFKIGLIGSFNNHYKGIAEAIKAIGFLKNSMENVELHILGSGSLESHYRSVAKELGINDLVFFDGILKGGDEVAKWLSSLDLYIQPSYTEGLPRALIEAMSVGLPAVASNVGGIPELLSKDTLIKPYDSEALAKKIKDFVDSQQLRFEQGKLNYQKAKEYDQNVLKKRRSEFWQSARDIVKRSLV
ncbi:MULTISPECIES: glycosyltransferase family 4 protein [unclassified Psychrobacter]|uniref:glycosyltransferase family 4 protein n=1 Tax=unclassified Psychrobacter TaxID=196806 RepID=UPI0018F74430|nr:MULTISPECIES: glycosyltransferase family 4 protein [unclassified Psychrobacter]